MPRNGDSRTWILESGPRERPVVKLDSGPDIVRGTGVKVMPVLEHEAALSRALAQNDGLYAAIQLMRGAILKAETRAEYLAQALGRIAEEDVPLVEWAEDDLISEFARMALEAAPPGIESIDVEAALSPKEPA